MVEGDRSVVMQKPKIWNLNAGRDDFGTPVPQARTKMVVQKRMQLRSHCSCTHSKKKQLYIDQSK